MPHEEKQTRQGDNLVRFLAHLYRVELGWQRGVDCGLDLSAASHASRALGELINA